jgi:NAD(P)-dependent dehydrogenase (short-subunit alcohol dehydrogenase family)
MEMQDRAVIVTGGASGIGKATALLLAREGALVFVGDIDEAGGQVVAAQAAGENLALEFLPLDLTRTDSIEAFTAAVRSRVERVEGLVNGAGWDRIQPFMENPPEMWERLIAINLLGAIRLTRAVLPPMIEARAGKIVNISSDAGRVGSTGETVVPGAAGAHARGADAGDPVPPHRPAGGDRRGGHVLPGPAHRLRDRPGAERQRRLDDGGLSRAATNRRKEDACWFIGWACRRRMDRRRGLSRVGAIRGERKRRAECTREPAIRAARVQQSGVPRKADA